MVAITGLGDFFFEIQLHPILEIPIVAMVVPCHLRQTLVQGLEQLGVVIPTAIVDCDEGDARLHQPTGQKGTVW